MPKAEVISKGMIDRIGFKDSVFDYTYKNIPQKNKIYFKNHEQGIKYILKILDQEKISAVGHRVVHGGEIFKSSVKINEKVIKEIINNSK